MTANVAPAPTPPPPGGSAPGDWTEQGTLLQPRQAAFWLFVLLLGIGGLSFVQEQLAYVNASTTAWAIGLILLALYAIPVYLLVNTLDLFEREPRSMLIGALLWGGVVATFLAGNINHEWGQIIQKVFGAAFARDWSSALVGPGVEELVKFLGVVVIYLIARHEFDDILDGFVYGALVGLGFTVAEDMYYFFARFVGQAGLTDLGGLWEGFFLRVIVGGPYSHVLLTGLTGMGLAYYVTRPDVAKQRRILIAVGLYAAGVLAHFIWNSRLFEGILGEDPSGVQWFIWAAVKGLPFLVLLALVVRWAVRREQRWVRDSLAPEVATGLVTEPELNALDDPRERRAARRAMRMRKGISGERLLARLQHAQVALALIASGKAADRETRLEKERAGVRDLRAQLDALPDTTAAAAAQAGAVAAATGAGAAAPPLPLSSGAFSPTHLAPAEGLASWVAPVANGAITMLAPGLELEVLQRAADWALVRASNGWTGWVDGRRLVERPAA